MKRRKLHTDQLSLLVKRLRWSDLPDDSRHKVVHRLAQLLIQRLSASHRNPKEHAHAR